MNTLAKTHPILTAYFAFLAAIPSVATAVAITIEGHGWAAPFPLLVAAAAITCLVQLRRELRAEAKR